MAALTAARNTTRIGDTNQISYFKAPIAAATKIFQGAIVCANASGLAVPGSTSTTLKAMGVAEKTYDNSSGGASAFPVEARAGVFWFNSGTAGDAITQANLGATVYIIDDNTVGLTNGGATRSVAGVVVDVDSVLGIAVRISLT
jgi:hypothetical protein